MMRGCNDLIRVLPLSPPPPQLTQIALWQGWLPIGVGPRLPRGGLRENRYVHICTHSVCMCMCSANTRYVPSYVRMRVYRVTHADPAADQNYLFNRDYCVGVGGDDRAANWNQMTRDAPRQWRPLCAMMHGDGPYTLYMYWPCYRCSGCVPR